MNKRLMLLLFSMILLLTMSAVNVFADEPQTPTDENTYLVILQPCNDGLDRPIMGTFREGYEFTLPENPFTAPHNMTFDKWQIVYNFGGGTRTEVRAPGETFTVNTQLMINALWKDISETYPINSADLEVTVEDAVYTGEPAFPIVTLMSADGVALAPENYDITYNDMAATEVGTYDFVITGKSPYDGFAERSYNINPPAKEITSIVAGKKGKARKSFTVKWEMASDIETGGIDGFEVQYSAMKNFKNAKTKMVEKNTAKEVRIKKGIQKGKKYFVMVRAYKKVDETTYCSDWSAVKTIKTKK